MGRTYAGIVGLVAFSAMTFRGIASHRSLEGTIALACGSMFALAAVGFVVGELASWFVAESVQARISAEIARSEKEEQAVRGKTATAG